MNIFVPSAKKLQFRMFRVIFLLLSVSFGIGGVSIPSLAECAVDFLTHRNITNTTTSDDDIERVGDNCDANIQTAITKFYDDTESLITTGVNVEHLENSDFVTHKECIMKNLRYFNVSDMFLKGIAYQKLDKVHQSDHSYNLRMTSQQILLLYALQVCDPRSFYRRHANKIFSMNMRPTNEQAICILNHLNENNADESYQFRDESESIVVGDSDAKCRTVVKKFVKTYYYVLDRARNFSVFNLNPAEAIKCRTSNDKSLIDNIMLLTIFHRLKLTQDELEAEEVKFYEIARASAKSFFQCFSMYD